MNRRDFLIASGGAVGTSLLPSRLPAAIGNRGADRLRDRPFVFNCDCNQRMYRQAVPADASARERRTTTQTLLGAFSRYMLIIHPTRLGREVQPTRLSSRQREILQRLGFDTPAQVLSRQLPRPP